MLENMELKIYKDKAEVAANFSEYLARLMSENEELYIALSGGSTPKVVFDYLSNHYQDLDWSRIYLFWGDERCVSPEDDESNYKMTRKHLLSRIQLPEENIFRVKGENSPEKEVHTYSKLLQNRLPISNGIPQFDLVILGMGSDGHTASIFPHEIDLWESKENCEVAVHPDSGQKRITITGKVINNAKSVAFLVTGSDKNEKVTEIINKTEKSNEYPASLVAPTSNSLLWFLDEDAASGIK